MSCVYRKLDSPENRADLAGVCTEKSIHLETTAIQSGGILPKNLSCVNLVRSVEPGWRLTPAKSALFSGESSFRYTQHILIV